MVYQALYRKYRPTSLTDVVGQEQNLLMLKNTVLNNKISHAYIFSGPRGTGKTTVAKIFAKMVNCENLNADGTPCEKCSFCTGFNSNSDIIELDAASNNGVDEIREIRDKVKLVPNNSKYKVYIIDEVHMMTNQAFNALLKTLEEPPKHIIFILATTEYHKIPLTITSRCQKFSFTKISVENIVKKLKYIVEKEKKTVDEELLKKIAVVSDGGLRDAINLLDQMFGFKNDNLVEDDFYYVNKNLSDKKIVSLLLNIKYQDKASIVDFVEEISELGVSYSKIVEQVMYLLKDLLIFKTTNNSVILSKYDTSVQELIELFNDKEIYDLILDFNDLIIKIKTSLYSEIIFITTILKMIDRTDQLVENQKTVEKQDEKSKSIEINEQKMEISKKNYPKLEKIKLPKYQKEIINNAFCFANKTQLNELRKQIDDLDNVDLSKNKITFIRDINVAVVGNKYIILTTSQELVLNKAIENDNKIREIIGDLILDKVLIAYLLEDNWQQEREKYISNIKSGYKYLEVEIPVGIDELNDNKTVETVNELEKILGKELIEYK